MKPIPVAFHIGPLESTPMGSASPSPSGSPTSTSNGGSNSGDSGRLAAVGLHLDHHHGVVGARALHVLSNLSFYRRTPATSSPSGTADSRPSAASSWRCRQRSCSPTGGARARHAAGARHRRPYSWPPGHGATSRAPAHGGRWRSPHYPVVRHVLRRPGRRRLPVPIFQAMEDFFVYVVLISSSADRTLARRARPERVPARGGARGRHGAVGIERFLDEHLWLGEDGHLGSLLVQVAGIALAVGGVVSWSSSRDVAGVAWRRRAGRPPRRGAPDGAEAAQPVSAVDPAGDPAASAASTIDVRRELVLVSIGATALAQYDDKGGTCGGSRILGPGHRRSRASRTGHARRRRSQRWRAVRTGQPGRPCPAVARPHHRRRRGHRAAERPEAIEVYLGALQAGLYVVPINHHLVGPRSPTSSPTPRRKRSSPMSASPRSRSRRRSSRRCPLPGASPSVRSRVSAHTARGSPTSRRPRPGTARLAMS